MSGVLGDQRRCRADPECEYGPRDPEKGISPISRDDHGLVNSRTQ
jgi:hypothetical protein